MATIFRYKDTWDRSGEVNRREFQERTRDELQRLGIAFTELTGSIEQRIAAVAERLKDRPR